MRRLPSTGWVGPSALSCMSDQLPGALPQAGIARAVGAFAGVTVSSLGTHAGMDCVIGPFLVSWWQGRSKPTAVKRQRRDAIPAWGNAPCEIAPNAQGLKARPIPPSVPQI